MSDSAEPVDNQQLRAEAISRRLGTVPTNVFAGLMQSSVMHAAATATVDPQAAARPWRNLGPRNIGGRIRSLVQDPRNPNVLYAGSGSGGLWKTSDAGDSWVSLDDFRPPIPPNNTSVALPIGAIGIAHAGLTVADPAVVYVGTGEPTSGYLPGSGLFWSTDGGQSFLRLLNTTGSFPAQRYERILVDPWEPRRFWAVSPTTGLLRATPSGANAHSFINDSGAGAANGLPTGIGISDIAIVFGDPNGGQPASYTVLVGVVGQGVYEATYTVATESYSSNFARINIPGLPASYSRVKVAFCASQPDKRYAAVSPLAPAASNGRMQIFSNVNSSNNWQALANQPPVGTIAWYAMVLEVNPHNPRMVFCAQMNLYRSTDAGGQWQGVITNDQYNDGDLERHPDIHTVLFDVRNQRTLWVANDSGVTRSQDLGNSWRRRAHGILATQMVDITTHPNYPYMFGAGFQDNGSWVSHGGSQSWLFVGHSDGGDIGFEPNNPRLFHTTTQAGAWHGQIATNFGGPNPRDLGTPAPDLPTAQLNNGNVSCFYRRLTTGFAGTDGPVFHGVLVHHPSRNNESIIARFNEAYRTTNGTSFTSLNLPAFNNHGAGGNIEVTAVAYGVNPNQDIWIATSHGELFLTGNNGGNWNEIGSAGARGQYISAIAPHPSNAAVCAISVAAAAGRVFITGDSGSNWVDISGNSGAPTATAAANRLPISGITALVFDRRSPNNPATAQTLYAGTLAGVFVIRNALAPTAAPATPFFAPAWRSFNNNLPLVFVLDLETVRYTDSSGSQRDLLRVGTFGRGAYECDLGQAASVRLLLRNNIADTGMPLVAANNIQDEPRVPPGTAFVNNRSIDIRVDTGADEFLRERIDAVEFDEQLRSSTLGRAVFNQVFVRLSNIGGIATSAASVSLYYANVGVGGVVPDLPADFWAGFPKPSAADWTRIGTQSAVQASSAEPQVLRFIWNAPEFLNDQVALLALVTDPADDLLQAPLPPTDINNLVASERRAALHVVDTRLQAEKVAVRDCRDEDQRRGAGPWALSSNDILIKRGAVEANPADIFSDSGERHDSDDIQAGQEHHAYIRVHNHAARTLVDGDRRVHLYAFTAATAFDPAQWRLLGSSAIPAIAANASGFAPVISWAAAADDPNPGAQPKFTLIAAVIARHDRNMEILLANAVSDIASFWRFFSQVGEAHHAAVKTLPWRA